MEKELQNINEAFDQAMKAFEEFKKACTEFKDAVDGFVGNK